MRKLFPLNLIFLISKLENRGVNFQGSKNYWIRRYESGRNSGGGSYGILAEFKANFLNDFVRDNQINSIIEFGCGDGNNLSYFNFPSYLGLDVSEFVILSNKKRFKKNNKWAFMSIDGAKEFSFRADLTLSLDVIYHLVEDEVYEFYMSSLFTSSAKFVVIYSSNVDFVPPAAHVRHRKFSDWVELHRSDFELIQMTENPHKSELLGVDPNKSFADFFIYKNRSH
jgi:SAM-dependent methyltransferase